MIGSSNQSLQTYYGGSKGLSADKEKLRKLRKFIFII